MNIQLFEPYPKQGEFIQAFADTDDLFGVVVSPRGAGKTLLGINLMLYWLLSFPCSKGGWISPIYGQTKSVFDHIVDTSKQVIKASNRMEGTITFINDSTLKFLSGDSFDSIRGWRFEYLIMDEVAFIKPSTIDAAILPTLNPIGKKCLMISTPKGKNHFFTWFNKRDVVSFRFKLEDCPYINPVLIDQARQSYPPDLFRQEYLAEFVDSSNDVFTGIDHVSTIAHYDTTRQDVYVGIDTGLTSDMSVLYCLSPMGRTVMIQSLNNEKIDTIATKFINTLRQYNVVGGFIETNGIGRAMYDLVSVHFRKIKPFTTTLDSKTDMVRKLISDIESMSVSLPSNELCPELHTEFSTYTYKMSSTGKLSFGHISGGHDDYVDGLLLANYSRNQFLDRRPIRVSNITSVKPSFGLPK